MNSVQIPSPLSYLAKITDPRELLKTEHRWEDMMLMSLMAMGSGRNNILAIAQWIEDQKRFLLNELGIRNRYGQRTLPAQATIYRFFWFLDAQLEEVQGVMLEWGKDVLKALGREERIALATDGKHLRGTRRGRKGEEALVFLSVLVQDLGLSLGSMAVHSTEAKASEGLIVRMQDIGIEWVMTADAGVMNKALAEKVVEAKGATSLQSKTTRKNSKS